MRKKNLLAGLVGAASILGGIQCATIEHRPDGLIEAFVLPEGKLSRLVVQSRGGHEISSVRFDPQTGIEDYGTQRFFGFDAAMLMDLADRGRPEQIPYECVELANLWQGRYAQILKQEPERGVLRRQSQLMALCLDSIVGHTDACSHVPDFNFRRCCVTHDVCYETGGTNGDRLRCDVQLMDCIAEQGHPILSLVYFAGVRAFGGSFFHRR